MHLNNESCAGCHSLIDPIGFGFEKFDAIGQRREKLKLTFTGDRHGEQGSASRHGRTGPRHHGGKSPAFRISRFSSPRELGEILAGSDRSARNAS